MKETSRSPLKDLPLRQPGQSIDDARRAMWGDKVEPWVLMALIFVVLAIFEWSRYLMKASLNPVLFTAVAILVVSLAAWRVKRWLPHLRALRLGAQGEKVVGQYLEGLRAHGYRVFHDLIGDGFNVDHVLIGPSGIYAIETKTWTKPRTDAEIHFEGGRLKCGDFFPDRDPVKQAHAAASWLAAQLLQSTGKQFLVRPVILFPGWFIRPAETGLGQCWVLEPKALPRFLAQEPHGLPGDAVNLAAYHLSRMVRSSERERQGREAGLLA